jgi:hypothetical protein
MMNDKIDAATIPKIRASKPLLALTIFLAVINLACANPRILESANVSPTPDSAPTPERAVDNVQDNLASVERMGFDFVYVFTRKDGAVFNGEDITFLRSNAPSETNQWRWTEDKKTIIAASNYRFPPENLETLRKRFNVEDRSRKKKENANINANSNAAK